MIFILGLGLLSQPVFSQTVSAADDRSNSLKAGHIALAGLTVATVATTCILAQKGNPLLASLPLLVVLTKMVQLKWKNGNFKQDARIMRDQPTATAYTFSEYPLAFITVFGDDIKTHRPMTPQQIRDIYNPKDAEKIRVLWSTLASKIGIPFIDRDNNYGTAKRHLEETINFIERELDRFQGYTDIEFRLTEKVLKELHETHARVHVNPSYFRDTNILMDPYVFDHLDDWAAELYATSFVDKFFSIRWKKKIMLGRIVDYPSYSTLTYNGACECTVQLLKQLARLKALKLILDQYIQHANTQRIIYQ